MISYLTVSVLVQRNDSGPSQLFDPFECMLTSSSVARQKACHQHADGQWFPVGLGRSSLIILLVVAFIGIIACSPTRPSNKSSNTMR